MPETYDVLVIGAGPGGYPAAIRASQLGLKTVCVEKEKLGGVCLNWGCIPSKALLKTAELVHQLKHADDWGIGLGEPEIDYAEVIGRSRKVAEKFERGVKGLFKKYKVDSVFGTATLVGPGEVQVASSDGEQTLKAKHIVVATGARATFFPGLEPDGERILTYREAIVRTERPDSVVIVGAGAIGMEFAYFMNAMGVQVTVLEALPQVLPNEDPEVAKVVAKSFDKSGITLKTGVRVQEIKHEGDGVVTVLEEGEPIASEIALLALGVTPNTSELGLEELGVELERGFIKVDPSYRTSVKGVYAVGDVCDLGPALAHTATRQAHVCVERIAGHDVPDVDMTAMPMATYCQPQVASVGFSEAKLKEDGVAYKVGKFPFQANGKAVGAGHGEGFVKVLVGEKYGEILGVHIVGSDATEMIAEAVLARTSESTAELLASTVHAHPTMSEALYEAVANALGESVHI